MNKQKAKEWLSAYVEGMEFEDNPELKEALRLAESDPELKAWWTEQNRIDAEMSGAMQDIPVPADLEARLMETVRTGRSGRGILPFRLTWLASLAAVLVLGGALFIYMHQNDELVQQLQTAVSGTSPDDFDHYRDGMAYFIQNRYFQLDHLTTDLRSIENWLLQNDVPVYGHLPDNLVALDPIGCKELTWKGRQVSLVCFHNGNGGIVHLFVMEADGLDPEYYRNVTTVAVSSGLETGGWVDGDKVYVLVGSDPEVDIEFALG